MKKLYILILFSLSFVCANGYSNHSIYEEMEKCHIDSIHVVYFPGIFTNAFLNVNIYKSTANYILDSLYYDRNDYVWDHYPASLSNDYKDYILSSINSFFIAKDKPIFKLRKKKNSFAESDYCQLSIDIYYSKGKKKSTNMILGSAYYLKPDIAGDETVLYTTEFRRFLQLVIYITASYGPYSERYYRTIDEIKNSPNHEVFEFGPLK